jgi:hypothetical protein
MLRISVSEQDPSCRIIKLEGKLLQAWVDEVRRLCVEAEEVSSKCRRSALPGQVGSACDLRRFVVWRCARRSGGRSAQGGFCFGSSLGFRRSLGERLQHFLGQPCANVFQRLDGAMNAKTLGRPIARLIEQLLEAAPPYQGWFGCQGATQGRSDGITELAQLLRRFLPHRKIITVKVRNQPSAIRLT